MRTFASAKTLMILAAAAVALFCGIAYADPTGMALDPVSIGVAVAALGSIRNVDYVPMIAGGAITPNRLVKLGSADQTVVLAAAATDRIVGVSVQNISYASGAVCDVVTDGEYEVIAGGTVTRGDPICSDSAGAGITAAPVAGTNNGIVGYALDSAVVGDLFTVAVEPGTIQG